MSAAKTLADDERQYYSFSRNEWLNLRANTPLTFTESDLENIRGINERLSLAEVEEVYLPLSRLLNLHVAATQQLHSVTEKFLGNGKTRVPYIIGVAGSVAVGKSTTARILQTLLAHWHDHPQVELVTTDGFLFPNRVLEERGLMKRKGFPESYDRRRLLQFVMDVKAGVAEVAAPVYSHLVYNLVPDEFQIVRQPDILILEGLNVLQGGIGRFAPRHHILVSDYFDFSIYVDAAEEDIQTWFLNRFQTLRNTAFTDPQSYFHRYAAMSETEAADFALNIWRDINGENLRKNILPTRTRARLILEKSRDHSIQKIRLRKV